MEYRKDIDGLRAVAVIPVILYHSGSEFFIGGYLGVDIFFVISGFLITSILAHDLSHNKYSIMRFYERRARRILPALFSVLFVTTVIAYFMLGPEELKSYSQSLVSVNGFASNIYFYLTSGYFATASEELPLLHTWSLAVEEQFYVIFPILMSILWFSRKSLLSTLFILSGASFITCLILIDSDPSANFYLLPSRAWELFVGAIVALNYQTLAAVKSNTRQILSALGIFLLIFSLTVLNKNLAHPGFPTLLPVIGTLLIIAFAKNTFTAQILSIRPLVFIGLISYSLYLWHQPIFAILRIKSLDSPSDLAFLLAITLSLIAAWLSYRIIESPFRQKDFLNQKQIFTLSVIGLLFFITIGILGHLYKGWPQRFQVDFDFSSIDFSPERYSCHANFGVGPPPANPCIFNAKLTKNNWAVLGDSHGVELSYALGKQLREKTAVQQLTYSGCPPAIEFETPVKGCHEWMVKALEYLVENSQVTHVLLAFRHTTYISKPHGELNRPRKVLSQKEEASKEELHALYWQSFELIIKKLKDSGKQITVLFPTPEPIADIKKLTTPNTIFNVTLNQSLLNRPKGQFDNFASYANDNLERLVKKYAISSLKPAVQLCDDSYCHSVINGKAVYFDNNHLSNFGASLVLEQISQ
ncbi:acyltransferase family protein [Paraglaciecola sp. 25GB23A]|uniref:acyltransferase family protein n=1 Tax=Paraglaciecola sp. 25GB23A TaxID=3156068 RepID=UPI0032AF1B49